MVETPELGVKYVQQQRHQKVIKFVVFIVSVEFIMYINLEFLTLASKCCLGNLLITWDMYFYPKVPLIKFLKGSIVYKSG